MIAYTNIDTEDGLIRLSFLLTNKGEYIMPSLFFVRNKNDFDDNSKLLKASYMDNPIWIFRNFKRYLTTYLQHTVSKEDGEEFSDFSDWVTEDSAQELLEIIKFAESLNCQIDYENGKNIFYKDRIKH